MRYYGNDPLIPGSMSDRLRPQRRTELKATLRDPFPKQGRPAQAVRQIYPDGHAVEYESIAFASKITGEVHWTIRWRLREGKADKDGRRWEWAK